MPLRFCHPRSLAAAALLAGAASACAPAAPPAPAPAPAAVKRVRIVHTNDFHGRLLPQRVDGRPAGGSAVLAAHFDSAAARFPGGPTLVLSGGDDMQGTAVSNLSWGRATIDAHNAAGYDAAALGNHEFDWGLDTLRARIRQSRFPWIAANVYAGDSDRQPDYIRPWVMIERGGVKVAVIGAALSWTPDITVPSRTAGLRFGPEAPAVSRAAREARAAGADFVVVTLHVGAVCQHPGTEPAEESRGCAGEVLEMARALTEPVDLVVGGHTHRRVLTREGGVPVSEAASYSTHYSLTDLERPAGGPARVVRQEVRVAWASEVDPDTGVARVVEGWTAQVRPIIERRVVALAAAMDTVGSEFALGSLIADAHRAATGAQVVLVNNGSIRRGLPAGDVSYGVLYELQPFQNELVALEITGAQLRAALENALAGGSPDANLSGMTVTYDPAAPRGSRVRSIRLDGGREVGDADRVTMGVTEFMAQGGDRYASLAEAAPRRTGIVDLDALITHLQSLPQPVQPPPLGRWRRVP